MYEHRTQQPLTPAAFLGRLAGHLAVALLVVAATGIVLAPLAHRVLHLLHWDAEGQHPADRRPPGPDEPGNAR